MVWTLLLAPLPALSCISDTDCGQNGRCAKTPGWNNGVCLSAAIPDNGLDPQPVSALTDMTSAQRKGCLFDADCGAGNECLKASATAEGICVKKRP